MSTLQAKVLFISDIHGCFDEMLELLARVKPTRIICCGDMIDRGPKSKEVVQYIMDNNIECVLGNHELMAIEAHKFIEENDTWNLWESDWYLNGGKAVYNSYDDKEVFNKHIEFFKSLPVYIDTGLVHNSRKVIAAHTNIFAIASELPPANLTERQKFQLVWNRAKSTSQKEYLVVHGHTPTDYYADLDKVPYVCEHSINIDTGAAYKTVPTRGRLTGLVLPALEFVQVG